ncbi:MAG: alpha/beta fold hydrolase [Gammaproteobacteria bacterium]
MDYMLVDPKSIGSFGRAVYSAAYSGADAIRAGHAWYRAWPQDIIDGKTYKKLEMPVLPLGAPLTGFRWLPAVKSKAAHFRLVKIENSGHFLQNEQPEVVTRLLLEFFR